ncbi:MAG: hypothetical protein J7K36_01445, partial [Archaeoglobaceae archaeon]|nr:hypothetical protein [Archaeoglobaceae archaeon]
MESSISVSEVIKELQKIDIEAANAYIGALRVLKDKDNPDRFSQAAHSLREVTALISRKVSIPQEIKEDNNCSKQKKENLKKKLERKFVEKPELIPYPAAEEVKKLIKKWSKLHNDYFIPIAHHGKTTTEKFASRLSEFEAILLYFLRPVVFPDWPLTKYLIKIVKNKPREVMEIIKEMKKTDNFRVHIDLIDCAIQMPSSIAKEIVPFIKDWVDTPYSTLLPEKIGELSVKLIRESGNNAALECLDTLLDVREREDTFYLWQYGQILNNILPKFLKKEPYKTIEILCKKLQKAIELEGLKKEQDFSYIWRPAIEEHTQNMDYMDVKNLLVASIRDSLKDLAKSNSEVFEECFKLLSNYKYSIFRRIELYLMRRFPELLRDEIPKVFSDKKVFEDIRLWHEYYHLLQTQ